ncbi:MAG: hypothetical protein HYS17_00240 [Micavibrio aeruginosavorus]|uniref:Coenzyme Q-binding protein COQ10 START domain-containing protein n=1 Tax=Micavibrio aeruginosavorus TaxID=349221 RepID=A0A7T5UI27_9BACT|nr:MAG: hypothetical protein HYS17_00240 [Micavibrio aeruginosavorus]
MKQINLTRHFPYYSGDIYDLIMDINAYPQIYPMIKGVKVIDQKPTHKDIELELNIAGPFIPGSKFQTSRVTGTHPRRIQVEGLKGPLKVLNLHWALITPATGGTHLDFRMEYESGRGILADMAISGFIKQLVDDTLRQFERHAALTLSPVSGRPGPQAPGRGRKPGAQP